MSCLGVRRVSIASVLSTDKRSSHLDSFLFTRPSISIFSAALFTRRVQIMAFPVRGRSPPPPPSLFPYLRKTVEGKDINHGEKTSSRPLRSRTLFRSGPFL